MYDNRSRAGCPAGALLTALLDGELTVERRVELEDHVGRCPSCAADLESQRLAHAALRASARDLIAPPALRRRIQADLRRADRPARMRRWAIAGALAAAVVAVALFGALQMAQRSALSVAAATIARAHTAETMGQWPVSFASADPVAVADWVRAQTGHTITVPDYGASGYTLAGVRPEPIVGDGAVTLVYEGSGRRITCTVVYGEPALHGFGALAGAPGVHYAQADGVGVAAWLETDATYLLAGNLSSSALAHLVGTVNEPY